MKEIAKLKRTGKNDRDVVFRMVRIICAIWQETVYYCNIEEFLRVIKNKDKSRRTEIIYRYILDCSVIIIDDVMYANIMPEDLPLFYRAVSFLNEERSLIIITNRELSGWINAAEDTHLMQTLVDRITANSQIIRL